MENLKDKLDLIIQLAFEAGRTYENRYIHFDLYNTINFQDFQDSKAKGAGWKVDIKSTERLLNIPGLNFTERMVKSLSDPIEKLEKFRTILFPDIEDKQLLLNI